MSKANQKIKKNIIILTLLGLIVPYFAYAQTSAPSNNPSIYYDETGSGNCSVCGSSPEAIEDFIGMINSILAELPTKYAEGPQAGQYRVYGPWQGGLYGNIINTNSINGNIYKSIVAGTLRNLDQTQSTIRTTATLLGIYGKDIVVDGSLGIAATLQPWPIVRDYQRLLEVDTIIGDKIFEMGIAGGFDRKLSKETINQIREVFGAQSGSGKLFKEVKIGNDTTIANLLKISMTLNHKYKNRVILGGTTKIPNNSKGGALLDFQFNDEDNIVLYTNPEHRSSVEKSYSCARTLNNKCSADFKQFSKAIKNISTSFASGTTKSTNKIITASKRLKTLFSTQQGGDESDEDFQNRLSDFNQREAELLSIQGVKKRYGRGIITGALDGSLPRSIASISKPEGTRSIIHSIKDSIQHIGNFFSIDLKTEIKRKITGVGSYNKEEGGFRNGLLNNISGILSSDTNTPDKQQIAIIEDLSTIITDHESQTKLNALASSDDSRKKLSAMLSNIRLLNDTIYNSNKKNTIYENIARTCELQCSNLGGNCRL